MSVEALERGFDDLLDVVRTAVEGSPLAVIVGIGSKPNLVAMTTSLRKGASASPTTSSFTYGP